MPLPWITLPTGTLWRSRVKALSTGDPTRGRVANHLRNRQSSRAEVMVFFLIHQKVRLPPTTPLCGQQGRFSWQPLASWTIWCEIRCEAQGIPCSTQEVIPLLNYDGEIAFRFWAHCSFGGWNLLEPSTSNLILPLPSSQWMLSCLAAHWSGFAQREGGAGGRRRGGRRLLKRSKETHPTFPLEVMGN